MAESPPCAPECAVLMRDFLANLGVEATISHLPPIIPTAYDQPAIRCPHGVMWFGEPTSDQIAAWRRDKVR